MLSYAVLIHSFYNTQAAQNLWELKALHFHAIASRALEEEIPRIDISPQTKLGCLMDMMCFQFMTSSAEAQYSLMKVALPFVIAINGGSNIVDFMTLSGPETFDLRIYAYFDAGFSMVFGRPTLLRYAKNLASPRKALEYVHSSAINNFASSGQSNTRHWGLEGLVGCPDVMIVQIARITELRDSAYGDWIAIKTEAETIEQELKHWSAKPTVTGGSHVKLIRIAVQFIWRETVLLYLYVVSLSLRTTANCPLTHVHFPLLQAVYNYGVLHAKVKKALREIVRLAQSVPLDRSPGAFLHMPYFMVRLFEPTPSSLTPSRSLTLYSTNDRLARWLSRPRTATSLLTVC